ncbi:hypothetical protein SEUCBS139899_007949 [Sporothrix eucalyptigena]
MPSPPRSIYKIPPYPQDSRATRVYGGPVRKWDSKKVHHGSVFGPRSDEIELFEELRSRYEGCRCPAAIPLRTPDDALSEDRNDRGESLESPWIPRNWEFHRQQNLFNWYLKHANTFKETERITGEEASSYLPWIVSPKADLHLFPTATPVQCQGMTLVAGGCAAYNDDEMLGPGRYDRGTPEDDTVDLENIDEIPDRDFIFNAGGKVLSLAWAPLPDLTDHQYCVLAVAVVPHEDRSSEPGSSGAMVDDDDVKPKEKNGSIQIWRIPLKREGYPLPGDDLLPRMYRLYCCPWGWPKRMDWCVNKPNDPAMASLLAVLFEDGIVRVFKVPRQSVHEMRYEKVTRPLATLSLPNEPTILATSLAWMSFSTVLVGYTDGSVVNWAIGSTKAMATSRIPVHGSAVQDLCLASPSMHHLVVSRPVEGFIRLIDIRRPSSEHTFHPNPVAGIKNNLLGWSDHMQGFVSATPFNSPLNNSIDFMHYRHFPVARKVFASSREGPPTCLAASIVHPFVLVGTADGKVWIVNLSDTLFPSPDSAEDALLVLSSEFRPPPEQEPDSGSGDAQGPRSTLLGGVAYTSWPNGTQQSAKSVKGRNTASGLVDNSDDDAEPEEGEGSLGIVIHEGATAVTSIHWHPNADYGTWCAIGFASGLVIVKNLKSN